LRAAACRAPVGTGRRQPSAPQVSGDSGRRHGQRPGDRCVTTACRYRGQKM